MTFRNSPIRHFLVLFILFSSTTQLGAQNGSWWEPAFPAVGDTITIFFDPSQNSDIPVNPASLVLHWGVNESSEGHWNIPPQDLWPAGSLLFGNSAAVRSPMNKTDQNLWEIKLPTDGRIQTIHYVVNTGTPASTGSSWGHNLNHANWNITLLQSQVNAVILAPEVRNTFGDGRRTPAFLSPGDTLKIIGAGIAKTGAIANLKLILDDTEVASVADDTLMYELVASQAGQGMKEVSFIASDTSGVADTTLFFVMINPQTNSSTLPGGIVDGINYSDGTSVTLSLFAPFKKFVYVIGDFNDWMVDENYFMKLDSSITDSSYFWITINGLTPGRQYAFQYLVDGQIRIADPYTELVLDPRNDKYISSQTFPDLKPFPLGKTDQPVSVLQTDQPEFSWVYSDTFRRAPKEKLVIYELLIRDFVQNHDYKTLIDTLHYFETLGVNAIELMPVNEFEGNLSWGYNPSFYFAPDKYYGPRANLKKFVDECHKRGIAVILDMVLNHSYGQSPLVRLYWDEQNNRPAANNPWYNTVSPNPVFSFGYDFNHQSPATRAFVDRVNRFWITQYKIDGYRFDFTKGFTNKPGDGGAYDSQRIAILERIANKIWQVDSTAYVILEHFAVNDEEKVLAEYGQGMMLWGNMNYNYNEATMGYNSSGHSDFSWGYFRTRNWTVPNLVTYMESHDEERLMYKNLQYGNSSGNYQIQNLTTALARMKLAAAFFFTYPGPKMLWQFGELGYDFSINYNGRTGPKPIRWDYLQQPERLKLFKTFSALIRLRKEYGLFTNPTSTINLWLNDASGRKRIILHDSEMYVSIVGNFGVDPLEIDPQLVHPGVWYDFFAADSFQVTGNSPSVLLQPGDVHIFSDKKFFKPENGLISAVDKIAAQLPGQFQLYPNYPNPFNPTTTIPFEIPVRQHVQLEVFNILGERVKILLNKDLAPGVYHYRWDGKNFRNLPVSSGIYVVQFRAGNFTRSHRMLLMR